ncbi:MAG: hypothetical protein AAFN77_04005 [Planctomycetota bacterium]
MGSHSSILNQDIATKFPWAAPLSSYGETILTNLGWATHAARRATTENGQLDSILFTSPATAQGVTTIAGTTAVVAATDPFCKILFIDCAASAPARALFQGIPHADPAPILLGRQIEQTALSSLDYLALGDARHLRSTSRRRLAGEQLWDLFDLIVIDYPVEPVRGWLEHIAHLVSAGLIVAGRDSSKPKVNQLAGQLNKDGVSNVGVIFNQDGPRRFPSGLDS